MNTSLTTRCSLARGQLARPLRTTAFTAAAIAVCLLQGCIREADAQAPPQLVAVSSFTGAGYTDIAVGADGTLHAVWQDVPTGVNHKQVLYSASRDGVRWSAPVNLADAADSRPVTAVRTAVDGAGRVYAFWKLYGTGVMGGPEVGSNNTRGSEHGSLRYRVLERGQWSRVVEVSRDNKLFSWFPAVDAGGRLHLVWSENSDPSHTGVRVWSHEVNTVRHTQLDGTALRSVRVVLNQPNTGFWGLSGYVDARGLPRFVGIRQDGGDASNQQYFHWDGVRQSLLGSVSQIPGNEVRGGVQLVRDAGGVEHVIYYAANSSAVAALPLGANAQPIVIYQLASGAGGEIQGFQASHSRAGEMIVTVQAKQAAGGGGADLFVARYRAGRWNDPVNVTSNAARIRSAGVVGTSGSALAHVSTYSARYAAAALDASGGVNVLMSNIEASVPVNTQITATGSYTFRGGWSYPKAYYARLGGTPLRASAPPPPTAVSEGRLSAGAAGDQQPPSTPAPAPTGGGGLPVGSYACSYNAQYVGAIATGTSITILPGGQYRSQNGSLGNYSYDQASRTVRWTSGPFADRSVRAQFLRSDDGKPAIRVEPTASSNDPSQTNTCVLH
jgi:hypothetical protein